RCGSSAKVMHQPYVEIVTVVVGRSNVVKVLGRARQVGLWDKLQEPLRYRTDPAARRGQVLQVVPLNRLPGIGAALADIGVEKLNRLGCGGARAIGSLREIASALSRGRNRGKLIEGILTARAVVIHKEERLGSSLIDVRDVERPTERPAKTVLRVSGFRRGLPGQGEWSRIQGRIAT